MGVVLVPRRTRVACTTFHAICFPATSVCATEGAPLSKTAPRPSGGTAPRTARQHTAPLSTRHTRYNFLRTAEQRTRAPCLQREPAIMLVAPCQPRLGVALEDGVHLLRRRFSVALRTNTTVATPTTPGTSTVQVTAHGGFTPPPPVEAQQRPHEAGGGAQDELCPQAPLMFDTHKMVRAFLFLFIHLCGCDIAPLGIRSLLRAGANSLSMWGGFAREASRFSPLFLSRVFFVNMTATAEDVRRLTTSRRGAFRKCRAKR